MLNRRSLLTAGTALACSFWLPRQLLATPAEHMALWPGSAPGGGGPQGPAVISAKGAVSRVSTPSLQVLRPAQPNGAAVLIAAGGGYKRVENGQEALPAARWLAARGVMAFVLTYRLPREGWNAGAMAPLQDAQRALRLIRARAAEEGIDTWRIGLLGFSAGGHLLGMAATRAGFRAYEPIDDRDRLAANAAIVALAYPVITLLPPYDRTSTRRSLIGEHPSHQAAVDWSVETYVTAQCPPVFVVQAADDPVANPQNSLILAQACQAQGVAVERLLLPSGGHGFGMGRANTPTADWPNALDVHFQDGLNF
nr:alpha/beta hydrolase [uncultured Pseudomonas sp.]